MESLKELIQTYIHNLSIFYCKKIDSDEDLDEAINYLEKCIKNKFN